MLTWNSAPCGAPFAAYRCIWMLRALVSGGGEPPWLCQTTMKSPESVTARAILKRQKITLASVQEPMVGKDSPEDAFVEHILVGMAEFYSKNLSREIRKGLLERARQGHLVFRPPYGYKREVIERQEGHKRTRIISRPVINDKAAPIVRRIFELFDRSYE